MTARPRRATALPSPFDKPSPVTRDEEEEGTPAGSHARAHARASTRSGLDVQVAALASQQVQITGLTLAAALARVDERRASLAAAVAMAREAGVPDASIRARLVIAGLVDEDVAEALR